MTRVLRATSGLLTCVGIACMALAVLAFPTQPAWADIDPQPVDCSSTCAGGSDEDVEACASAECAAKHCFRTYADGCNGWCILLNCQTEAPSYTRCGCGYF